MIGGANFRSEVFSDNNSFLYPITMAQHHGSLSNMQRIIICAAPFNLLWQTHVNRVHGEL